MQARTGVTMDQRIINLYPGTQHAFNNDTGAARYNKAAGRSAVAAHDRFFKGEARRAAGLNAEIRKR